MKINKYLLEIAIFLCGAVVMVFELVGSRIFAPYVGTSIFVWTSLIGTILASLSIGYYSGGKLADKKATLVGLSSIIFCASLFVGLTTYIKDPLLLFLQTHIQDIKWTSVIASVLLFCPASIALGMISPYAAKLKIQNLDNSASTIGGLSAISTFGSIFGTFFSGFYLIPHFGTNKLLIILAFVLVLTSLMLSLSKWKKIRFFALYCIMAGFSIRGTLDETLKKYGFIDIDTEYNRIWIFERVDAKTQMPVRVMGINNENHSSMFLASTDLVNQYTKYYHLAKHFFPNFKHTLMLGGAAYSYPKDFLSVYKDATIDVEEIDTMVTDLAKQYFHLTENPRLRIYHEDGRVFLNTTKEKYDVIFGDAFTSHYSVPYQLSTKEAVQKKFDILNENGLVILNIISSLEGKKSDFFQAEYATYKSIFPQVYVFPVTDAVDAEKLQNIILVALKSKEVPSFQSIDTSLNEYLGHQWKKEIHMSLPVLTDDYAPVDYYMSKTI